MKKEKLKMAFQSVAFCLGMVSLTLGNAYANDVFKQGKSAFESVYKDIVGISTPIAAAGIGIALSIAMLHQNPKAIDEARDRAKKIGITWIVLNGLGYILVYVRDLLGSGGQISF